MAIKGITDEHRHCWGFFERLFI